MTTAPNNHAEDILAFQAEGLKLRTAFNETFEKLEAKLKVLESPRCPFSLVELAEMIADFSAALTHLHKLERKFRENSEDIPSEFRATADCLSELIAALGEEVRGKARERQTV